MAIVRKSARTLFSRDGVFTSEKRARLDALTDEQIEAAAKADPDAQVRSNEELDRMFFKRSVRLAREASGLSQSEFARQFRLNVSTLRNWEQGRFLPDAMTRAYLEVIRREPEMVKRVLGPPHDETKGAA